MNVAFDIDYFVGLEDTEIEPQPPKAPMGYSFVLDQLAQGSAPPPGAPMPFDVLVLCAMEYQPNAQFFKDVQVICVPLDDAVPTRDEIVRTIRVGKLVADHIRKGQRVLTTCFMGRNRSGWVNGVALIELGYSALDAVAMVRNARGGNALSNHFFVQELHAYARSRGGTRAHALA